MCACARYCQGEKIQPKLRTKNWGHYRKNKEQTAEEQRKYKDAHSTIPQYSGWRHFKDSMQARAAGRSLAGMDGTAARGTLILHQQLPAHTTVPELGRNPHTHFLAPPLPQTVWNTITGSQWNPCPISKYSPPVGLHRTGSNLQAPVQIMLT